MPPLFEPSRLSARQKNALDLLEVMERNPSPKQRQGWYSAPAVRLPQAEVLKAA
jgi:hypothetical protein